MSAIGAQFGVVEARIPGFPQGRMKTLVATPGGRRGPVPRGRNLNLPPFAVYVGQDHSMNGSTSTRGPHKKASATKLQGCAVHIDGAPRTRVAKCAYRLRIRKFPRFPRPLVHRHHGAAEDRRSRRHPCRPRCPWVWRPVCESPTRLATLRPRESVSSRRAGDRRFAVAGGRKAPRFSARGSRV